MKSNTDLKTKQLVGMAMFAALAYSVTFVFRIPVMFLTFDAKDAVIIIASLIYGPVSGICISFVVALLELITISGTGVYGFIMNFASSAIFSSVAALVYKYRRTPTGAIIGFFSACVSMVIVMTLLNITVTPFYMGVSREAVIDLLPKVIVPFNIAKGLMNSAFAMLLYKPIILGLRRAHLIKGEAKMSFNLSSVIMLVTALLTLALAIVIFVLLKR